MMTDWRRLFRLASRRQLPPAAPGEHAGGGVPPFMGNETRDATFGATSPPPTVPVNPKTSVARVPGVEKLDKADLTALAKAASTLGIPVDWLATVISFETGGTFSPTVRNKAGSGAFGLIQFMPTTASNMLKLDKDAAVAKGLAMNFKTQLEKMVVPYLKPHMPFKTLDDVYLAIFYPAAKGKAADAVIASTPSKVYTQNAGFDAGGKGYITKADITSRVRKVYSNATSLPRIVIATALWMQLFVSLGLLGVVTYELATKTDVLPFGKGKA